MATRRNHKATGPTVGDTFEQAVGRYAGRVIEIDKELGLTQSARMHVARTAGTRHAEAVRRRRTYFLATTISPDHLTGRVFRVSEKTLAEKYVRLVKGTRAHLDAATATA